MTTFNKKEIESFIADKKAMNKEQQLEQAYSIVNKIRKVNTEKAYEQIENFISIKKPLFRTYQYFSKIAAVLIIPLFLVTIWSLFLHPYTLNNKDFSTQKIFNPSGIRSNIVLPDGSKVCLNAESSVEYKLPFSYGERNIQLKGEAFFDVKKDPKHPFVVQTSNIKIKVLGTRFNVKAYSDDNNIEVVLERGKIQLNTSWSDHAEKLIMKPGDWAVVDKNQSKTTLFNGNTEELTAWKNGKLVFDNSSMSDVIKTLDRWYGVNIKAMDYSILQYRITTTFENEPLSNVLELLCLSSPIRYTETKPNGSVSDEKAQIKLYKK